MQNQSSRSYATATSDATGDDVVCYELMKSIFRSKRTPIISKHVMALLITPTPDMTATWCPHAAIVRELQRLPRGEIPVKPVVSSNRDLLIWVKRNEPYGARIDMRSGLLYLEHMALLAIARTTARQRGRIRFLNRAITGTSVWLMFESRLPVQLGL